MPLRLPWTLLIQERLPPGAAAVLLNRSHSYPDLILAIDAREKRMFEAIDNRRSIAEIAERAAEKEPGWIRRFFEKLWGYDQVVFDASNRDDQPGSA